ncbi:MAG: DUF885 domain-containing protein [Thermoleophilia bacterium]|nr:DUF885 domain-containing protein [Thermoleophilia bacterium]
MADIDERRRLLAAAIAEQWEYDLHEAPEFATTVGDPRYQSRWSDLSLAHIEEQARELARRLKAFEAIDTAGFPEQEVLNHRLMVRELGERLEEIRLKNYVMPVDQLDGIHLLVPQYISLSPLDTVEHFEDYISRLRALPRLFEQVVELLDQGRRDGLMPPRFLLEKTVGQCESIAGPEGEANAFGRPAAQMPAGIRPGEAGRLQEAIVEVVDRQVRPAYQKLARYIAEEYAPHGRTEDGVWSLPDGEARYRVAIRRQTSTDLHPDDIHQLGLEEVARIEGEQLSIARGLGFSDLRLFRESLKTERRLFATSREQILKTYRRYIELMKPELPRLFGLLPRTDLEVRPTETYREHEASGAEYWPGTPDGSRPGIVYVNTGDYQDRSLLEAESTAYHEALPGHHFQVAVAQALPGLPPFRQHASYNAYSEGWALYSERLGKEIGFYQDPYSDFGRLSSELLRAVRLVVDTGLHHKRWSREQAVQYLREHSSQDEVDIQAETDRYIVLPAQALSYKLGQLEILRLRTRAEEELGSDFDLRGFHDRLLDGGALPLDILRTRVDAWIEAQQTAHEVRARGRA